MFPMTVRLCFSLLRSSSSLLLLLKHLRSSRSHWTAVSWSCGWTKSSICPGSCVAQTGWSWSTGWVGILPLAPDCRGREAGWWVTRALWGLISLVGSGSGRARSVASRWNRTDWTWGRGCVYLKSMAVKQKRRKSLCVVGTRNTD